MGTMWGWYSGAGIFLAGLALPLILGRVSPNYWYGFRISRTMNSTALWYAANRYAGWRLLATGTAIVATPKLVCGCRDLMWTLTAGCVRWSRSAR